MILSLHAPAKIKLAKEENAETSRPPTQAFAFVVASGINFIFITITSSEAQDVAKSVRDYLSDLKIMRDRVGLPLTRSDVGEAMVRYKAATHSDWDWTIK